jgi:hypothetical protein
MGITELPQGYVLKEEVDFAKNKKQFIFVNAAATVLMIVVLVLGYIWKGFSFEEDELWLFFAAMFVALLGILVYIVLHEMTHGAVMQLVSGVKPKFGVKLPYYAYAYGEAYFTKGQYILVALAPVLLWGVVFGVLSAVLNGAWFWCFCFLQAGNISGAAGDLFVTVKTIFYPKTVLVYDTGVGMSFYLPEEDKK